MFAIIRTGGKQHRVAQDAVVVVEKLTAEPGSRVAFEDVLLVGGDGVARVGSPRVSGARVEAEVLAQERAPKVIVFKKKRRQNYRRKRGHRQAQTRVRITGIVVETAGE
ncbi:MAG: 50S ribosomal protein L21 [Alphaproteobacteria bacterium]|nr:50S ribosomal protein L21 [Alphaproteobacteria bacterium]